MSALYSFLCQWNVLLSEERDSLECDSLPQWRPALLSTTPEPPAISLIINDRNQMDSGSHADYWVKKFYISRVWMPTKSKPFKANQRASSLLPVSAKSFVSAFPPGAVRRQWLLWLCSAWSRDIHACSIILKKLAHHLHIKSIAGMGHALVGSKKKQNKLIDCKPSYDVSMN